LKFTVGEILQVLVVWNANKTTVTTTVNNSEQQNTSTLSTTAMPSTVDPRAEEIGKKVDSVYSFWFGSDTPPSDDNYEHKRQLWWKGILPNKKE